MTRQRRSTSETGRCGELLAMYQLELRGIQASLVDRSENDLWARTPSGRMLTVQVKTATEPKLRGHERLKYYFAGHGLAASTDVFALVALHAGVVLFCAPENMKRRMDPKAFTHERMDASIREHFA